MDKEERAKLESLVKEGKWNYVLKTASFFALGMMFLNWISYQMGSQEQYNFFGVDLFVLMILGVAGGLFMWSHINKKLK